MKICKSSKDNNLRQFSFKVLHKIILTKEELKKYNLTVDDACSFCFNPDSVEHTFIHNESANFFTIFNFLMIITTTCKDTTFK